jgi:ATPases involved in chromosome partitioning
MKIITIGTLKGGTGKTTTTFNLGGILAKTHKVLLIDVDPQCNLSLVAGIDVTRQGLKTSKNIFEGNTNLQESICKSPVKDLPNLDIISSSIQLTATELNIVSMAGREQILNNFILDNQNIFNEYDYILIDTNPSMSIINQNAFLVADSIILISDVSLNGIQGAELFIALWENARKQLRKANNVKALIINNYDKRINLSGELLDYCRGNKGVNELLLNTIIPSAVKIKETELEHKPVDIPILQEIFYNIIDELKERGIL